MLWILGFDVVVKVLVVGEVVIMIMIDDVVYYVGVVDWLGSDV